MEVEKEQKLNKPLTKTEQELIDGLQIGLHPVIVSNPFSGERVMLQPKAVALYDYIKGYEIMIQQRKTTNLRLFDTARYLFQKLWPNSYMRLLD
jgi:hypothetical protein